MPARWLFMERRTETFVVYLLMGSKGLKGFETYYCSLFGERWPRLRDALVAPVRQVARLNEFASHEHMAQRFPQERRLRWQSAQWIPLSAEAATPQFQPLPDATGLLDTYWMDLASILPPIALNVQAEDRVLDLCAAPGGKTLLLAEAIGTEGELVANEISDRRRARLHRVLREYVPAERLTRIRVTGHDGSRWCLHEKNAYDRILLDAPCSGERHLLESPNELKTWSESRSKNLTIRQYALLASALQVVKPGGRIVYSTCALSERENDGVIARLLKRREGEAHIIDPRTALSSPPPIGEPTEHGWMILPDTSGYGPIYFSVLERTTT